MLGVLNFLTSQRSRDALRFAEKIDMEPQPQPLFNIEEYLDEIVEEVERRQQEKESGDTQHDAQHQRQVIHEMVGKKLGKPLMSQGAPSTITPQDHGDKSYDNPELKPQVDSLIDLVFERDLDAAIDQAKAQNSPAVLDAFHDALVDKIHDQLIQAGKLKPI